MTDLGTITTGIGLGIAYAAAPGAVNTEAIRRGIAHGAHTTFLVETGSLIGDSLWALLALTGVTFFAHYLAIQLVLGIAGGCFLLRMAWLALYEAFARQHTTSSSEPTSSTTKGHFATGVVFGLANPVGLAFWSGMGSSVVASGVVGMQFMIFFLGFFTGAVLWCIGISAGIRWGRHWIRPVMFRWISALCGLALGYFGLRILWTTAYEWLEQQIWHSIKPAR
ncbi:LysE family translocator [Dictyobacter kobayashii]|uniref:Chemotactic transduction protein ChpE n=1 Tax=Dictyobacter kobayashii TaxID=2014872 RepID=A0A402AXU1_9CHLR|nr:LysE family transporter [Dictyobacter kobayashii]GCE23908.1 chemotactic transduction protein ChpE [Dictyobacter kobayashii]